MLDPIPELKRRAAVRIAAEIRDTQVIDAAATLDIDVRRVCDIRAGRLAPFSLERLLRMLTRLRVRIDILANSEKL
jgi:hypothetical protein